MRMLPFNSVLRRIACVVAGILLLIPARTASISFTNPTLIPTADDALVLVTADVNNDGRPDLIYIDGPGDSSHTVHVLLGNGDGTFTHSQDINLAVGGCCSLAIADVTGDGIPDLIVAGNNGVDFVLSVMKGNGNGTFQSPVVTQYEQPNSAGYPDMRYPIDVGDINGDGNTDLVLTDNSNGALYLMLGDGTGNFTYSSTIQTYQSGPTYLVDLNGDGNLDLVATDPIGARFLVYLGQGKATFSSPTAYTVSTSAGPFLLVDVNGDGHPDMLFEYYPYQLGYFPGNPDGTFGAMVALGNSPSANPLVAATDLTGGGAPDLAFLTASGIAVSPGMSGPEFGPPRTTITGGSTSPYSLLPTVPAFADFNGDGHLDMAMAAEGGIAIFLGQGNGSFSSVEFYDMGQEVGSASVAKFSGSSFEDIAVTLPAPLPRLLIGNGSGTFSLGADPNPSYASSGADILLLPGDFNGDGKPDLNEGASLPNETFTGTDSVVFNEGGGNFEAPVSVPNTSPVMADFNGDGRMDLVNVSGEDITVSLGQANGSFVVANTPLRTGYAAAHFGAGDVNHDGKPDLILDYGDHFEVWLGNGDGTFTYSNSIDLSGVTSDFVGAVMDVDGDGNGDVILLPDADVSAALGPLTIFYGNGDGTFQSPIFVPLSHRYSWVTVADLNNDGRPDLVLTDGAAIAVMMNLGSRMFDAEKDFIAGRSVSIPVAVTDVNGDGLPDMVVGNTGGTTVTVLLNQGAGPNSGSVSGDLTVSPEPSNYANSFVVTLTLSGGTGSPVPTGTVSFSIDQAFVTDSTLTNGSASMTQAANTLIAGQHTIVAAYNGDTNYAPRNFSVSHTIDPPVYATSNAITVSPQTVLAGQTVRLVATVTSTPSPTGGTVTFLDGGNSIGAVAINSQGVANFDTSLLSAGTHALTAAYQGYTQIAFYEGDVPYTAAIFSPSTSSAVTATVDASATITTLSPSATSPTAGTVVTFTAAISSPAGTPFGGVTFLDGSTILGTLGLSNNATAAFSTASLSPGMHTITANYNSNGSYAGSTSPAVTINVGAAPGDLSGSVVSMSQQTDPISGTSTLVASVTAAGTQVSGTVTFIDNGVILGRATVGPDGTASRDVGILANGAHNLTVSFGGGQNLGPSVSPELLLQWPRGGPGFNLVVESKERQIRISQPIELSVRASSGFAGPIDFSCASGLPQGYVCEFTPTQTAGSGSSRLRIVPQSNAASPAAPVLLWGMLVVGFLSVIASVDRRRGARWLLLLAMCALGAGAACGTHTAQIDNSFVLTIRATSGAGANAIVDSTQVQVIPANE
jgi:Bacterial Ig-like domain (group 3)/FG-GAP-like repeat/FG-GAP repeat